MRSNLVMFLLALALGGVAAFLARHWLENATNEKVIVEKANPTLGKVLVAAVPLKFGIELSRKNVQEVEWPSKAIPKGAFRSYDDLLKDGGKRVVLTPIAANEPVLKRKITGPGQRASLSALLREGMEAVTIRVNDVLGVAGFILPGDRVDVMLTRQETVGKGEGSGGKQHAFTDKLLQNVRVLAVDQIADESVEKPVVSKAVTLEVRPNDSQKLVLASAIGRLSLSLRKAGSIKRNETRRITVNDLGKNATAYVTPDSTETAKNEVDQGGAQVEKVGEKVEENNRLNGELSLSDPYSIVGVTRSTKRTEYNVTDEPY